MSRHGQVLDDRVLVALSGEREEQIDFLQGLVTNDVAGVGPDKAVYAALLTPQGKYLADFLIVERGGALALDVTGAQAPGLVQRLSLYRLRRKLGIAVDEDTAIAAYWGAPGPGIADPRHPDLGTRDYGDRAALAGAIDNAGDYDLHRLALGIPASGRDLVPDETFILEAGFERLHGVDFRKGCYVGQEIVARMKHKATLRKGLVPVRLDGEAGEGTPVMAGDKPAGTLRSVREGAGLAHLRFDRAGGPMTAGAATVTLAGDPL